MHRISQYRCSQTPGSKNPPILNQYDTCRVAPISPPVIFGYSSSFVAHSQNITSCMPFTTQASCFINCLKFKQERTNKLERFYLNSRIAGYRFRVRDRVGPGKESFGSNRKSGGSPMSIDRYIVCRRADIKKIRGKRSAEWRRFGRQFPGWLSDTERPHSIGPESGQKAASISAGADSEPAWFLSCAYFLARDHLHGGVDKV